MNDHLLDRLSSANPVQEVTVSDAEVDALLHQVLAAASPDRPRARRRVPHVVPLTAVLAVGLAGAAVAGVGGSIVGSAPDSPDDPVLTAPRAIPSQGHVTPLSQAQVDALERKRQQVLPTLDAGSYFAALSGEEVDYRTIYQSDDGGVVARATAREVCVRYQQRDQGDSTGSCVPTAIARTHGVYVFTQCVKDTPHPQRRIVAGIAPDGADAVKGTRQGVVQASTPVRSNGFVLITDQPIDTILVGTSADPIGPIVC